MFSYPTLKARPSRAVFVSVVASLFFIPGAGLPRGSALGANLERVDGRRLSVRRDAESVRIFAGETLMARYRYGGAIRKPYVAELVPPGGPNLLLDAPPDHLHHHGLMFACRAGGVNFWEEVEEGGSEVHVSFAPLRVEAAGKSEAAVIVEKLRWVDAAGRPLLEEERTLKLLAPAPSSPQVLVWESSLAPAFGQKSVTLSGAPYHGLGMRFVRAMDRGGLFFSSTGSRGVDGTNGKEAAWCAYTAEVLPGSPVTAAILDAPLNPRHPSRWFTMTEPFAYLSATHAIGAEPVTLEAGKRFTLRHAVVLFGEKADPARIERLHAEMAAFLLAPPAQAQALYVAPGGSDSWSGKQREPLPGGNDGPLASLAGARDAIRRLKAGGGPRQPVRVVVRPGTYRLAEPFVLEPIDSGTREAPVTYAGEPGSRPVVSGGRPITGWRQQGKLWVAEVPEVKSGGWSFGALWVNGERRTRARMPNEGYFHTQGKAAPLQDPAAGKEAARDRTAFLFKPGDLKRWANLAGAIVVAYHSWETSLHHIAAIEPETSTVVFTGPAAWPFENWGPKQRYHVENVPEALDVPGEWYLDRESGTLSYFPVEGEDVAKAEIIAPLAKQLVIIAGSPAEGRFVEHVHLENLRLLHTDWQAPPQGHSDSQAAFSIPGAVQAVGARHCSLARSEVGHLGTYGVWLRAGSQENGVVECEIHDLGAGGIRIGEGRDAASEAEAAARNTIDNNFIHDGGKILAGGVGVWIGRSSHNAVSHNEICDFNYTGVSVGWSWGYAPSSANNNIIEWNHIHDIGRGVLNDMGAIYTLGISPGTVERMNLMHDIYCSSFGGWGVYTDEGSTGIIIEKNIVYNTSSGCFHQHYGKENILRNNVFAFGQEGVLRRSREEDHVSFIFERNIVLSSGTPFHITSWANGHYRIDSNLYWDYKGREPSFFGMTFAAWQAKGRDRKSVVADPLFADAERFDFRLKPGSPAPSIGFEPIDTSGIGLYGDPQWVEGPKKIRRPAWKPPRSGRLEE